MKRVMVLAGLLMAGAASAQESASFQVTEYTFNGGGVPAAGTVPSSSSFQMTLASTGEDTSEMTLESPSFGLAAGFGSSYLPPGEVADLRFSDDETMTWDMEPSAGLYNLYRGLMSSITSGFGSCEQQGLGSPTATDTDAVPPDDGYFYLVTAVNLLDEEGTKGFQSGGTQRANLPGDACP